MQMTLAARALPLVAALLSTLAIRAPARAQAWVLDASAGQSAHGPVGSGVQTTGGALSLRRQGAPWLYLSAGLPFDDRGVSWGAAGAGTRLAVPVVGRVEAGFAAGAHGFGYRDAVSGLSGGGVTVEALPLLALSGGAARAEARSGLLYYSATHGDSSFSRTLHATDARLTASLEGIRAAGEFRYWRGEEGAYPYLGGGVELPLGAGSLWGYGGAWLSDAVDEPVWGVGGRVRVMRGTEVYALYQQETNDPLYWNPPRRAWAVGVMRRLGRPPHRPSPAATPRVQAGTTTFRLPVSASATAPAVAGDFNRWQPVAMVREGDWWTATLRIPPGVYRYSFRAADGRWMVPEGAPGRRDDGFGGTSGVLVVP